MVIYNERLINTFYTESYEKLLANPTEYHNLISEKLNRFNPSISSNCSSLAYLDALDHYIVKNVLESPSNLKREDIIAYRDYLYNLFLSKPMTLLDNILFTSEVAEKLFTSSQLENINNYKKKISSEIENIYEKITKNQAISKSEHDKLLIFLINQLNNPNKSVQKLEDNCFKIIINNIDHKSLLAKEFILKYTALQAAKDNNLPHVALYISNDHLNKNKYPDNENGCSYGDTSIITINRDLVISEKQVLPGISPITKMMQTVSHETRHSAQAYKAGNNKFSYESFEYIRNLLFSKYLSNKEYNEYRRNYRHSEIESDSNIYGWTFTAKFLENNAPYLANNIEQSISRGILTDYSTALGNKADRSIRKPKDLYNVYYFDMIIKNHPEELNNYPMLKNFYNYNGLRKNVFEIIESENSIESTRDSIRAERTFNEYFSYDINQGLLNSLDLLSLDINDQFKIIERLNSLLISEMKDLSHTITILHKDNLIEFEKVNHYRIEKIKCLINYFYTNQDTINYLRQIDLQNNNEKAFGLQLQNADRIFESLKHKIVKSEYLNDTNIYNELIELTDINYSTQRR